MRLIIVHRAVYSDGKLISARPGESAAPKSCAGVKGTQILVLSPSPSPAPSPCSLLSPHPSPLLLRSFSSDAPFSSFTFRWRIYSTMYPRAGRPSRTDQKNINSSLL